MCFAKAVGKRLTNGNISIGFCMPSLEAVTSGLKALMCSKTYKDTGQSADMDAYYSPTNTGFLSSELNHFWPKHIT